MHTALTAEAAKDLGRTLRFIRHAHDFTLHDVATRSGVSIGYVQNLEGGVKTNASEDAYQKLAKGYDVPAQVMEDFILRARVMSALERRGLEADKRTFIWRGIEQRLMEIGVPLQTDLAKIISDIWEARGREPETPSRRRSRRTPMAGTG